MKTHILTLLSLIGLVSLGAGAADAGTMTLSKNCNVYQAIQVANSGKRVGSCRPGKSPYKIVGSQFSNPTKPYPVIRANITIEALQRNDGVIRTLQLGTGPFFTPDGQQVIPDKLFRVAKKGSLTLGAHVNA